MDILTTFLRVLGIVLEHGTWLLVAFAVLATAVFVTAGAGIFFAGRATLRLISCRRGS
ncbi:hypothetical protein [Microvirga massiliensis]|uniref:hypothetical protein n=1 Tax=Microvirga massiliensis TaxID=1033741 RepID=UPI000A96A34C|nr:hypothetical protein [Microvirga massiliensis]